MPYIERDNFHSYNFFFELLGTVIQKLTEQVEKSLSNHGNKSKPAGGINVAQAFIKKEEVQEPKVLLLIAIIKWLN